MAIVKSKNPAMKNRQIILPVVGKVQFNDKCEFEVSNIEDAKELISIETLELELALTPKEVAKLEAEAKMEARLKEEREKEEERIRLELEKGSDQGSEGSGDDSDLQKEQKIAFIEGVTEMSELKELAASFPHEEWKGLKSKAKLREYLISKC